MRHEAQPIVIQGRPIPPDSSWWTVAPVAQFTAYVEREHLARMRTSKFSLLEPRDVSAGAAPRGMGQWTPQQGES